MIAPVSPLSFAHLAQKAAIPYVPAAGVQRALEMVGTRGDEALRGGDTEKVAAAVSVFVRNVRDLAAQDAVALERALLHELGAEPRGERVLPIKDVISVIALRNHIRYLAVCAGAEWSDTMRAQSSLSEVARLVQQAGGGSLACSLAAGHMAFRLHVNRPLEDAALDQVLGLLRDVATGLRVFRTPAGNDLEFQLPANMKAH